MQCGQRKSLFSFFLSLLSFVQGRCTQTTAVEKRRPTGNKIGQSADELRDVTARPGFLLMKSTKEEKVWEGAKEEKSLFIMIQQWRGYEYRQEQTS